MSATLSEPVIPAGRRALAFGLPEGSVRAVLAIAIFGTLWALILRRPDREVPEALRDLLFVIMGHYFAARRGAEAEPTPGPAPLYLPRGTVRLLLVAGTVATVALLQARGQLLDVGRQRGALTLLLVVGFLLGVVASRVMAWWRGRGHPGSRLVEDLKATLALAAAALLIALVCNEYFPFLPAPRAGVGPLRFGAYGPENVLAAVVGFYFGSRS